MWSKIPANRVSGHRNYFPRCHHHKSIPRSHKYHGRRCVLRGRQIPPTRYEFLSFFFFSLSWLHVSINTDTHVIWGLNLGQYNLSAAFLEAKALVKAFESSSIKNAGVVLEAIEIGNEADLYSHNGARSKDFTSREYVAECVFMSLSAARAILTHMIPLCQMD